MLLFVQENSWLLCELHQVGLGRVIRNCSSTRANKTMSSLGRPALGYHPDFTQWIDTTTLWYLHIEW